MTLTQLLQLTTSRVSNAARIWWINRCIAAEYRVLDHFRTQVANGNAGIADTCKRIVNLENSKGL